MKKLISLVLILCMACMLISAMADDDITGEWYGSFYGAPMKMTLNADGTASMAMGDTEMGTAVWTFSDGKFSMTEDESGVVSEGTLVDGVLTIDGDDQLIEFTREPVQGITVAEVNPEAVAEEFEGTWSIAYANLDGLLVDAVAAGGGMPGVKIENGALSFSDDGADSMASILGDTAIPLTYENGAMAFSVEIPNDTQPITIIIKAELLQDGMLALTFVRGDDAMVMYYTKAAAEEPAA